MKYNWGIPGKLRSNRKLDVTKEKKDAFNYGEVFLGIYFSI
jgi:hypothetical protein